MNEKPTPQQVDMFYAQLSAPPKPTPPPQQFFECECGKQHPVNYICMMLADRDIVRS